MNHHQWPQISLIDLILCARLIATITVMVQAVEATIPQPPPMTIPIIPGNPTHEA